MLRGRRSCAISERPTLSSAPENLLTPLFPLDTRNLGVHPPSDMINRSISEFSHARLPHLSTAIFLRRFLLRLPLPLCALCALCGESSFVSGPSSPNCRISTKNAKIINIPLSLSITISNIVGAPTYCKCFTNGAGALKSGPPQEDQPNTNCQLSTVNCELDLQKHAFYRGIIKYVGAPTFFITNTKSQHPPASEGGRYKNSERLLSLFSCSPLATSHSPLSLIIPVHPRNSPVSSSVDILGTVRVLSGRQGGEEGVFC